MNDIYIKLNINGEIVASTNLLGFTNENNARKLVFYIPEELAEKDLYLDIEKTDGNKVKTTKIDIIDNEAEYVLNNSILGSNGFVRIQAIFQDSNNYVMKYPILIFKINSSINATEAIEEEQENFVSQCQSVIDTIDTTGNGTKFLSDNGTYIDIPVNDCGVTKIISSDEHIIYLRDLETGVYVLSGSFRAYNGSSQRLNFTNTIACINKTNARSYVQTLYPPANRIQYIDITDDNHTITQVMLNSILSRLDALEAKI